MPKKLTFLEEEALKFAESMGMIWPDPSRSFVIIPPVKQHADERPLPDDESTRPCPGGHDQPGHVCGGLMTPSSDDEPDEASAHAGTQQFRIFTV